MAIYDATLVFKLLPIVLLPTAIIWDLIKKNYRDWIHYWGILLPDGTLLFDVTSMIYYRFFSG
jgi:hypothetical protein